MKIIISVLLLLSMLLCAGCAGGTQGGGDTTGADTTAPVTDTPETDAPEDKFEMREDQVYAADLLDSLETISLAFMGGSLTNGGISYHPALPNWPRCDNVWVNDIISYFVTAGQGGKQVVKATAVNAGLPGTTSDYAAVRFMDQVASAEPDVLFLEYSANDSGFGAPQASLYYEQIIRMCLELDKIPVIIFVHAAMPVEEGDSSYAKYIEGIADKDALAAHYGIKTVNAYEFLLSEYAANDMGLSFKDWLGAGGTGYYNKTEFDYYDVHPNNGGYKVTANAIKAAFAEDYEGYMSRPQFVDYYNKDYEDFLSRRYSFIAQNDERLTYAGEWTEYNSDNMFEGGDPHINIGSHHYEFPNFTDGIRQTFEPRGASITFKTTASALGLAYMSATYSSKLTFYLVNEDGSNGEEIATVSTDFDSSGMGFGMNRFTGFVEIPGGGEERTVRITVEDKNDTGYLFRFGYIIEQLG